ncbi:10936_t:CDS:2 [Cetraspora pellucida]|uniref:10936_t:CDS:1 n=1 Tax=Cetraspora pellucida TaxID=1433469 RepID=A0A9N9JWW8_9GLOM|nr:10936_t:CDS:2 [Cetraspora pellucida]
MPSSNKRKHHLEAARKSEAEHAYLKKNKIMHQSNDLLDYESIDEKLDNHIWVDEEIDEKANSRPTYNYSNSGKTLRQKKAELKKAVQNTKSITSYLSLTNSLRFNVASTSIYKFLATDAAAVDTIVIDENEDTIMINNAVDSIVKLVEINMNNDKVCIKQAIEKLDNMLEKNSKQIDKGTKFSVNPKVLKEFVENKVFPSLGIEKKTTISERTTLEWLKNEFLYEPLGCVHLTVEQHLAYSKIPNRYITKTFEVGVNHNDYWNVQLLTKQFKRTIDVLEIELLGIIFVFAFENSLSHGAFAEDALVTSRMNVKYSGKQP